MKRKIVIAGALVVIVSLLAFAALAQGNGYSLNWWTVDGGGIGDASAGSGAYTLSGTAGQPDAGTVSGPGYRLDGGFWTGVVGRAKEEAVYLPVMVRE